MDSLLEAGHNLVGGRNVMAVTLILEGFDVYGVAITVAGEYNELIPTTRADGETPHIISVYIADVGYMNVKFTGGKLWEGFSGGGLGRCH